MIEGDQKKTENLDKVVISCQLYLHNQVGRRYEKFQVIELFLTRKNSVKFTMII